MNDTKDIGSPPFRKRAAGATRLWIDLFSRHSILNNASAISFQTLKALVPLGLFGVALLGALGLSGVWDDRLKQTVSRELTPTAFKSIDDVVQTIMSEGGPALPVFAGVLLLWYASGSVRACMGAMNAIYEARDERSWRRRWGISLALALCVSIAVVLAVLAVSVAPRIEHSGSIHVLLLVVRWPIAAVVLGLAVGVLLHYGPGEPRQARWASAAAVVVVAAWIVESLLFGWFAGSVASFKSATGALTVFLVLAAFLYTTSITFLVGVQSDELLRKAASSGVRGIVGILLGTRETRS